MTDYKLVPLEPTPAMREPWKRMRGYCWYDKYKAMLAAAPAVQGEPDVAGLVEALTMSRETIASALRANAPDYFTTDADIARHVVIQRIDTALAAYRKQEPSHDNQ